MSVRAIPIRKLTLSARLGCRWRLAALLLTAHMVLAGCASIPGMAVDLSEDNPNTTWSEARTRDVYGTPIWSAPLVDGGKALYFEYKTVPTSRTLAIATAITTFGMVRDGGSLEFQLVTVFGPDGKLICADRASIAHALITCPHDKRLSILDELPKAQSAAYRRVLVDIEPRQYARGHFYLASEPSLTTERIAAAHAAGQAGAAVTDDRPYYFAAECSVLMGWYAKHLEVLDRDPTTAASLAAPYATALYEAAGGRGMTLGEVARDLQIISDFWQRQLDDGELSYPSRAATPCLTRTPGRTWSPNTLQRFDDSYFNRTTKLAQLAQALALADYPETPDSPSRRWFLVDAPTQFYQLGLRGETNLSDDDYSQMSLHSESWRGALAAERKALSASVSLDALAMPLPVMEQLFATLNAEGLTPGRQVHLRLQETLEAQLAIGNHPGALRTLATLGRYYLAQPPSPATMARAGDLLTSSAWVANQTGEHQVAASLATAAADAYLAGIQAILDDYGLGDEESRERRRDILEFVPYEYDRTHWDGSVTTYRVESVGVDGQEMLAMIGQIGRRYPYVVHQLSFALPYYTDPRSAAVYFDNMAASAYSIFSTEGAYRFRSVAAESYTLAGDDQPAAIARMYAEIHRVRALTPMSKLRQDQNCENRYTPERAAFAERFGKPSYKQIRQLFGASLADSLKEIDRRCKYGKTGLFSALN